ncbi:MAG TPA: zf-TFIIB domain-containing protein [Polyangiaceae bacterium]|nr:zf-TFIIB domain-containing protein [Polyangiaceae bacterium]
MSTSRGADAELVVDTNAPIFLVKFSTATQRAGCVVDYDKIAFAMLPHCPKCVSALLVAVEGTRSKVGASALKCPSCSGFWVPPEVVALPGIVETLAQQDTRPAHTSSEDKRTGQCPDGHGLLRRARVTWHDPYFLERCARCGGVWFDAGEWSRAAQDDLFSNLSEVWSPAWRKQLSDRESHASLEVDLRAKLGRELFDLLHVVANRLESHEHRGVALAYLVERLKHPDEFGDDDA